MKTIELLAVTQSVKGGKDGLSPYKMKEENLLPKFEPAARKAATAALQVVAQREAEVPGAYPAPVAARVTDAETAPAQQHTGPAITLRQALAQKNPFKSGKAAASAQPVVTGPVQTELSLDQVKVVRNDLNDSDLELVAASVAKQAEPVQTAAPERPAKLTGTVWNRLTARLFSIGRSWL